MKFLNIALISVSLPLSVFAERLIYPEGNIALSSKTGNALEQVSVQMGLGLDANSFELKETKQSLLGNHYYYQQVLNGHEVEGAQVVVSVDSQGKILKVYNNQVNAESKMQLAAIPMISEQMALELAWSHVKVIGELLDLPTAELVYNTDLKLIYKINISSSAPFGHFVVQMDATNGEVIAVEDAALPRMKRAIAPKLNLKGKPLFSSLSSAVKAFEQKHPKNFLVNEINFVNGTAQVFDPNPVVTLGRTDLENDSDASVFLQAYKNEDLKDISFVNGVYSLKGPKVTLIDFENPYVEPSSSSDGSWIYDRGNEAFNDAMTYLHIDRSIRYIESMGFTGSRSVFPRTLEVDANGVNGDDNSHYIPSSRRLAFGHGCVDDNEDADVILHELGHAIQHHINSSWRGGDTGAMGEGFGDYWAATYSVTTENGNTGNINWVFKWDGHNACWGGRKLNAFNPAYNPMRSYSAHSQVDGGISDELWSTPIFQAFLELYGNGVSRGDIDKIILEAHFGLGSGIKMPEMAKSIVKAAKALFPNQDYDQVYLKHFKKQKIL